MTLLRKQKSQPTILAEVLLTGGFNNVFFPPKAVFCIPPSLKNEKSLLLPPTGKNRCKTKNCIYSFSNLGNGMYQMAFFGIIYISPMKNRQIRYL